VPRKRAGSTKVSTSHSWVPNRAAHACGRVGQGPGQHLRGEVRELDPRQDEEAAVVHDPVQMGVPLGRGPADPPVAHAQDPGGRAERQGRHRPILEKRQVLEAMAEQLLIPEVMIVAHQLIPERLPGDWLTTWSVSGDQARRSPQIGEASRACGSGAMRSGMRVSPGPRHRPAQRPMGGCALGTRLGPLSRARMPGMIQGVIAAAVY